MARTRQKSKGRRESGCFMAVPAVVLESPNFRCLTTKAKALILDIGAKYNGHNNGDLAAPWSWMRQRGWRSKQTLENALRELRRMGMIELTRQGGLNGPSLYAFTWFGIDACKGKLDVSENPVPSGKWKSAPLQNAA